MYHHCLLVSGFVRFFNMTYDVDILPDQLLFCSVAMGIVITSTVCSTHFILSMTFERFYSIIRPHKAASFNTVKRAKITIVCIVLYSSSVNIPNWLTTSIRGRACLPQFKLMNSTLGLVYYWAFNILNFYGPFILLLIMNSFIIYVICSRSRINFMRPEGRSQGQGQNEGHQSNTKIADKQITAMLLLVTFGYLILLAPGVAVILVTSYVDVTSSPRLFAGFHLLYSIANKTYYTNLGINFYLYVFSGQKFRNDLIHLFKGCFCKKNIFSNLNISVSSMTTLSSSNSLSVPSVVSL